MLENEKRIIVALDFSTAKEALELVAKLSPAHCRVKVGKELFTRAGPELVKQLIAKGYDVFLDLKYHDIPNTVAKACLAAADLGVWMMNVHALGGEKMLASAREELLKNGFADVLLIGVSILTSMSAEDLAAIGLQGSVEENVLRLAELAKRSELSGLVCSAQEAKKLREHYTREFCLVTPGIRLADGETQDQKRVMTPTAALEAGSDYLVIGRAITQSENPLATLELIKQQIDSFDPN